MQLPSVALGEEKKLQPSQKPPEEMAVSEEDQEKIIQLELEKQKHPKGSREYGRLYDAIYFRKNRQKFNDASNAWQKANREKVTARQRAWRAANPGKRKSYSVRGRARTVKWAKDNPNRRKEIALKYYYAHKPPPKPARNLSQSWMNVYRRNARKTDVQFMLKDRLRATANRAFRRQWIKKPARTEALLGCTISEAKAHIESQFAQGMSWENRKSFVIDHHIPIAAFDLTDAEEVGLAFGWRNLKPLTQKENASKSATVPNPLPSWLPLHIQDRIKLRRA